ncbi:hypothetical protein BRADI_2g38853v3 [Brachypodium distachyon]|uniref:Uncharacterized protein n=1 Tax=Brachypodium distachyon TaxID=15368 RepID=A0A2K2DCP6_BRADI|nr:hypothetical protein BRADI_2g38853v3 [Brachypodium distachyon]
MLEALQAAWWQQTLIQTTIQLVQNAHTFH